LDSGHAKGSLAAADIRGVIEAGAQAGRAALAG
jgi:hypothetical protein